MDQTYDPDTLALLLVQQYLDEHGHMGGVHSCNLQSLHAVSEYFHVPDVTYFSDMQRSRSWKESKACCMCLTSCLKVPCCWK